MIPEGSQILTFALGHSNYLVSIMLIMIGLYIVISRLNLVKKAIGLNLFQNGVFLFYISLGARQGGQPPILPYGDDAGLGEAGLGEALTYANPLPHVLILTAIVVGISTMAVALALIVRIGEAYGTIEADEIAYHNERATDIANGVKR